MTRCIWQLQGSQSSSGLLFFRLPPTWRIDQTTRRMARPLFEIEMFHGSKPDLSRQQASRVWVPVVCAQQIHEEAVQQCREKLFYLDTREKPRHMWWPQRTGQSQGHQNTDCQETSTSTTMKFRINVFLQSPKRKVWTMMYLNRMLMV